MITPEDILPFFTDLLITTLHRLDSALLVAQELPDWQAKYAEALRNPLRADETEKLTALIRELSQGILKGYGNDPEYHSRIEQLRAALRKPPD